MSNTAEGAVSAAPPQMPENAWSELQSIAERLRWLANEPDATEGMASTVTWRQKLDDAAFLSNVAAAIGTRAPLCKY